MSDYKLIDVTRLTKFKEKLLGILTYTSPEADATNTSIEFIDTVSQSNGKISASKKKVSTFTGGNTAGLVPASGTNASGKFLGSDGKWSKPTGTTYNNYTTSTANKAGANGLVPAPGTGDVGKFLKGGSGWSDLPTASTTNSGIVSLSSSTNSEAENAAATPKAIKAVYAAASTAGATAGANAASSYATAAKNSADSASTYATNAKNSANSAADAASTAVTNAINGLSGSTPAASGNATSFVTDVTQTKGKITVSKSSIPTASTTNSGIVKLTDTTGSTDSTTAATPNSVTSAINALTGSVTDSSATETSTTFISNISQTSGVISATKKKLPTFAGSSQPGIVSASEGLSENYLLNATGGWTAIDEELDATSTNPVQNKTLYNLETYHTLTCEVGTSTILLSIDGNKGFNVKAGNCINLYVKDSITVSSSQQNISGVKLFNNGRVYSIVANKSLYEIKDEFEGNNTTNYSHISEEDVKPTYLFQSNFIVNGGSSMLNSYGTYYFTTGNVFLKLYFTGEKFIIVNNPVLIKYERYFKKYKQNGDVDYYTTSKSIKYANGLKMQWLENVNIQGSGGSNVILPLAMSSTNYAITEARKGVDLKDVTGYVDKYKGFFFVDTDNDHIADFFVIGY